jgi:hypothetical protein
MAPRNHDVIAEIIAESCSGRQRVRPALTLG